MGEGMADVKQRRRQLVRKNLAGIVKRVNEYLRGKKLRSIEPILTRIGRRSQLPYWYPKLWKRGTLPNLDGKTIGSIIEMLIVADIEKNVLRGRLAKTLLINPAKGVDVPDLNLGVKSPSKNWYTSEPFSNAYERLLGTEFDVVAVITNYQIAKKHPPLKIELIFHHYFKGCEVADKGLCKRAKKIRKHVLEYGDVRARKVFRFLAFAIQSDRRCKILLQLIDSLKRPQDMLEILQDAIAKFDGNNKKSKVPLALDEKTFLEDLRESRPLDTAVIDAADNWVLSKWQDAARVPNPNEWERLQRSRLAGKLGVSFALQWRYNFGVYFCGLEGDTDEV
jgi:hypothetical protein